MRIPRIETDNATGLIDKFIGLGKEVVGEVFDNQRLIEAGEAQQGKGIEKLKALRKQAKARSHEQNARSHESSERGAQRAKADTAS
ncbi:MAG TPA: hypothetical protein VG708_11795 [Mycobacteriales bacterium]|nr:hypothetical protein [Mycobacteriales bacterium]